MKLNKNIISLIVVLIFLLCAPVSAFASNSKGSINVKWSRSEMNHKTIEAKLYKIAEVVQDSPIEFNVTKEFKDLEINIDDSAGKDTIDSILDYIEENDTPSFKEITDRGDKVNFTDLDLGVYFVIYSEVKSDDSQQLYLIEDTFISIPFQSNDGSLIYDVTVKPKVTKVKGDTDEDPTTTNPTPTNPAPTTTPIVNTPSTPSGGGKLPQTGLLKWPIPVLTALGILFFSLGLANNYSKRKRSHE